LLRKNILENIKKSAVIFLLLITAALSAGCSASKEVKSNYAPKDIVLPGNISDWSKSLNYISGEGISFGFMNDNDNLYVCMVVSDYNKITKILSGGMKVALDPGSSDKKIFIQYPQKPDFPGVRMDGQEDMEMGTLHRDHLNKLIENSREYSILDNNENSLNTYQLSDNSGFKVKMEYLNYQLLYQLKIPLNKNGNGPHFFNSLGNSKINIQFATEKVERPAFKTQKNEGSQENEMMPQRGNREGRSKNHEGRNRNNSKSDDSPLKYSFDVMLGK
jgi:hypothetical protein